jgi:RNA polymerase sigma-70 factor (ECF subfamily)
VLLVGEPADPSQPPGPPPAEIAWLEPYPDDALPSAEVSPESRYTQRESVALAFLSALQLLPAKQRAVLLLRDVLGWQATECAELLEMSVPAVNSALQRARETLSSKEAPASPPSASLEALLKKYIDAWASSDVKKLVALLHEDAIAAMPPLALWLRGADAIGSFFGSFVMPPPTAGTFRMAPVQANGQPAFACFANGAPFAIHVLTERDGRIARLDAFLLPKLVGQFHAP